MYQAEDAYAEADMVASTIKENVDFGRADYSDYAILYRTNAQSRALEEKLLLRKSLADRTSIREKKSKTFWHTLELSAMQQMT